MEIAGKEIERDQLLEIVVSVTAVVLFIALLIGIGATYNSDGFSDEGAFVFIGGIVFFVLLMSGIGIALAYLTNQDD